MMPRKRFLLFTYAQRLYIKSEVCFTSAGMPEAMADMWERNYFISSFWAPSTSLDATWHASKPAGRFEGLCLFDNRQRKAELICCHTPLEEFGLLPRVLHPSQEYESIC